MTRNGSAPHKFVKKQASPDDFKTILGSEGLLSYGVKKGIMYLRKKIIPMQQLDEALW